MRRDSIQRRLITTVVLSQALLTAGLVITGVVVTYSRLVSTLDSGMQAHTMSVAALVRYSEQGNGNVYFDNSLLPESIDPNHPDQFMVWADRTGLLTHSEDWPDGLQFQPGPSQHWNFTWAGVPYHALRLQHVPVLDREDGQLFRPQTLTIVYASPTVRIRQQVKAAGGLIALASLLLLGATTWLASWRMRRGLWPLQALAQQAALVSSQSWRLQAPREAQEIQELRPLTESMTQMLARLERAFAEQREFLANAAHELKTPVAVLKSTLQSLLQRSRSSEEYRAGLHISLQDMDRLEQLLQRMLQLARAEQWAQDSTRRDLGVVDINSTCEAAVERIRGLAQSRGTEIHLATDGPMPFCADAEDLQLVWTNLLENAVRYSPEGGSVEVAVSHDDRSAWVTFQDHGAGISAADLPHVFERFYRGDPSRNRATGGFGLGLAIAKALVEAYGGSITAKSAPGEGTRMTVELPGRVRDQASRKKPRFSYS
ncbi:MAG TPA: HAMP domain-containing sensor histidine kinase [Terriglobales bacterium]|jgi:signal transduction histidine kinase|nr:HAMP domain-containing sensor histidine kinase [Terriglobales bacterium]